MKKLILVVAAGVLFTLNSCKKGCFDCSASGGEANICEADYNANKDPGDPSWGNAKLIYNGFGCKEI